MPLLLCFDVVENSGTVMGLEDRSGSLQKEPQSINLHKQMPASKR